MAFLSRVVDIPLFLHIEKGCLNRVDEILKGNNLYFKNILLLSGPTTHRVAGEKVVEIFEEKNIPVNRIEICDSTVETAERVRNILRDGESDIVMGVGGGRVIDVGKYAASKENVNFVSIPTTVANDGISSPVSVITFNGRKRSIMTRMPLGVIADLEIIMNAPVKTIKAGIGDLLSNISAVKDWQLARKVRGDMYDDFAALMSSRAAESVVNSRAKTVVNEKFISRLVGSLTLSGISMGIAGSSKPCSGAEHEFSHALDELLENPALHGEQAALGLILAGYLRGEDWKQFQDLFRGWDIPVTAEELNISDDIVIEALVHAPSTRPDRYTILEHTGIDKDKAREAAIKTGIIS